MSESYRATNSSDLSTFIYLTIYSSKWLELDLAERKRLLPQHTPDPVWDNYRCFHLPKGVTLEPGTTIKNPLDHQPLPTCLVSIPRV